jgi:hypothetical protein
MNTVSFAKDFQGIAIENMIGAPLVAAARANAMMAREQVNFILDHCFANDEAGYHPVMIRLSLTKNYVKNGKADVGSVTGFFELPLLTIVPINSLGMESLELNFSLEIKSHHTKKVQDQSHAVLSGVIASREKRSEKGQTSSGTSGPCVDVTMKAGNLPLPVGITHIIDLYSKSIHPTDIKEQ